MMAMKYSLITAVLLFAGSSSNMANAQNYRREERKGYTVYKVDSINSYYLIYARKADSIYKIVSKRGGNHGDNLVRIAVDSTYNFILHSSLLNRKIGNAVLLLQNTLLVNCFSYDNETRICLEGDSIRDLYNAEDIKGIYFIKIK
ncbi:hypothetical protein DCC81_08060 [Chitinophaga parva]|uniref:Uncharacterized protein n=1 Tax=Chitinophaga parva TaxID=2169414 RepID=A0A2T7BP22_9BACT|nr:hypothetical protein DCC81_08060 [Chitinophaga parva]